MVSAIASTLGEKIKVARKAKGLSQVELALKVGLSRVSISHIENGHRKSIKPEILGKLAEALEKPETYFYEATMSSLDYLPEVLREVIMHLLDRPYIEQERLGHIFKQIIDLREGK
jgi:transcriptional regulator with XRE-family HTH domain